MLGGGDRAMAVDLVGLLTDPDPTFNCYKQIFALYFCEPDFIVTATKILKYFLNAYIFY